MPPVGKFAETPRLVAFRLSPEAILEARKPLDLVLEKNTAHLYSLQTLLGAYLVLGNGIALFTLVQAAAAGHIAINAWFETIYLRFVGGLGFEFLAMAVTYFFGLFGSYVLHTLSQLFLTASDAQSQAEKATDSLTRQAAIGALQNASLEITTKQTTALWMQVGVGLITVTYLASGCLFLWGLLGATNLQLPPP